MVELPPSVREARASSPAMPKKTQNKKQTNYNKKLHQKDKDGESNTQKNREATSSRPALLAEVQHEPRGSTDDSSSRVKKQSSRSNSPKDVLFSPIYPKMPVHVATWTSTCKVR